MKQTTGRGEEQRGRLVRLARGWLLAGQRLVVTTAAGDLLRAVGWCRLFGHFVVKLLKTASGTGRAGRYAQSVVI